MDEWYNRLIFVLCLAGVGTVVGISIPFARDIANILAPVLIALAIIGAIYFLPRSKVCGKCGARIWASQKFCDECGAPQGISSPGEEQPSSGLKE